MEARFAEHASPQPGPLGRSREDFEARPLAAPLRLGDAAQPLPLVRREAGDADLADPVEEAVELLRVEDGVGLGHVGRRARADRLTRRGRAREQPGAPLRAPAREPPAARRALASPRARLPALGVERPWVEWLAVRAVGVAGGLHLPDAREEVAEADEDQQGPLDSAVLR